jgi:hypothetical protein
MAIEPRRSAQEDWDLLLKRPEGHGALGHQVAPSQGLDALDHLTHDRIQPKGRVPSGLESVTPKQVHRTLAWAIDLRDI